MRRKIDDPDSQIQEVLYELINRFTIDRKTMMLSCNVSNLTAQISHLRNKGVEILSDEIDFTNKYGRESTFMKYRLKSKSDAIKVYNHMKENQSKR